MVENRSVLGRGVVEDDAQFAVDGGERHVREGEVRRRRVRVDELVGGADDDQVTRLRTN